MTGKPFCITVINNGLKYPKLTLDEVKRRYLFFCLFNYRALCATFRLNSQYLALKHFIEWIQYTNFNEGKTVITEATPGSKLTDLNLAARLTQSYQRCRHSCNTDMSLFSETGMSVFSNTVYKSVFSNTDISVFSNTDTSVSINTVYKSVFSKTDVSIQ